ncbi:protein MOS2-like [Henckelia pumila]|uniref:protein MOS2-like n=1 Tax=Henckelia pumila TaxID=405737 RepID=UPI003C6DC1A4
MSAASALVVNENSIAAAPSTGNCINELANPECPRESEPQAKPIPPLPEEYQRTLKKLDPEAAYNSLAYGLNIRQPPAADGGLRPTPDRRATILELKPRQLREDSEKLPVEEFSMVLLSGIGWKVGMGTGCNAKEDVGIYEPVRKHKRWGIGYENVVIDKDTERGVVGFTWHPSECNGGGAGNLVNEVVKKKRFGIGEVVRIVSGRGMGMKGKVVEARRDGAILVLRLYRKWKKVKVHSKDVSGLGSVEEKKCLRNLMEFKIEEGRAERVNWLRNDIKVIVMSKKLKGGRLFLQKGVVIDVVKPGVCDIVMDETRELVQGVKQDFMETALPGCGGLVLVLCGIYKGVCGSLLEVDSSGEEEEETGLVLDAKTQEMLNVRLDQMAEYTGHPSDFVCSFCRLTCLASDAFWFPIFAC